LPIRSSARDVAQSGELLRLFETQRANVDAIEIPDQREHSQVLTPLDARADYRGDPRPGTTQQANGKSRSSSGSDSGNVRAVHNAGRCAGVGSNRLIRARWFGRLICKLPSKTLTILTVSCMPGRQAGIVSKKPFPATESWDRGGDWTSPNSSPRNPS